MLIELLPAADRVTVLNVLAGIETSIISIDRTASSRDPTTGYIRWATTSAKMLRNQVSEREIRRLIHTRQYELLLSAGLHESAVTNLLNAEVEARAEEIGAAVKSLRAKIERWSLQDTFVSADSSFFGFYKDEFDAADYQELLDLREGDVHFLLPMLVVDELDGLKEKAPTSDSRTRARSTLRTLNKKLPHPDHPGVLQQPDMSGSRPRGKVTIELLFDPPGHTRMTISDDEIIDRLAAVTPLTGKITFLTFDVGQSMRARKAGINVILLSDQHRAPETVKQPKQQNKAAPAASS